jgi:16S rRNA (cytosine1402-N4)-methyltransferase
MSHIPVLLQEVVALLDPKPGEFFIDGTAGNGGHLAALQEKVGESGKVLGIDFDPSAIGRLTEKFSAKGNVTLVNGNYANTAEILEERHLPKADGFLLDIGFSSMQVDASGRGFSFQKDEPLDMRYQPDEARATAEEVVNGLPEKELADLIYQFGEERMSRQVAKAIVEHRRKRRIETTLQLAEIVRGALPKSYERGRIHPATRTFQALRIYVNGELANLERALASIPRIVKPGGRVAVISFHSLEDRIVKNIFRDMHKEKNATLLTKKPIIAGEEELDRNPRSRSAKLRAIIFTPSS